MDVQRWDEAPAEQVSELVTRQAFHTETMTFARITLKRGAVVPMHTHENEQIATVLSGRMRFEVDGADHIVSAGESIAFLANVPHEAEALEDSVVYDAFSPPREDWKRGDDSYWQR